MRHEFIKPVSQLYNRDNDKKSLTVKTFRERVTVIA